MWSDTRRTRILLGIAFVARQFLALRFSYLHPDEHLQGPQAIAHETFGWAAQSPWEFTSENPLRSYSVLWLVYGIPMSFFSSASDPIYVLYTLRMVFFTLTWVLEDMAVDRLVNTRKDRLRSLFFVSTSYVTWTWQAHTLSNSMETILVLWFLVILHEAQSASKATFMGPFDWHYDNALAALIVVLGIFNRPTFIAFLLFPGLQFLGIWRKHPSTIITFGLSAIIVCALCIYKDTMLYGSDHWVITPLNFIKYNMLAKNLEQHGTHSRLTHLLVNLPQLLGPGILLWRPRIFDKPNKRTTLITMTVASGLVILSYFTHQEARFLLALVPLLCMQFDLEQFPSTKLRSSLLYVWMGFNLVMGIFMGMFHQAGVVPAQVQVRDFARPSTVIWWKTYTPPLWITGLQSAQVRYAELGIYGVDTESAKQMVESPLAEDVLTVLDLQGSSVEVMHDIVDSAVGQVYLVAPLAKSVDWGVPIWKTIFHWDPTHFDLSNPASFKPGLGIYNITAAKSSEEQRRAAKSSEE